MSSLSNAALAVHCSTGAKPLRSFAASIHGSAGDEPTRCMAAATLVTTLWQVVGRAMPFQAPSFLLVNAGGLEEDPLDKLASTNTGPGLVTSGNSGEHTTRNRRVMVGLIIDRNRIQKENPAALERHVRQCQPVFKEARSQAFGNGRAGHYAERMDAQLGLVTDRADDVILRLDRPADHERFRNDLRDHPQRLHQPTGYNDVMKRVPKLAYVAGSLGPAQWDEALVTDIVGKGMPLLFLPHTANQPLNIIGKDDLNIVSWTLASGGMAAATASVPDLPASACFAACEARLRSRLRHFPATYEFFILRSIRELGVVCAGLVAFIGQRGSTTTERDSLYQDLHLMCVRAVTLGVESLAYHGHGFDACCPRGEAMKVLSYIREKGEVSRRDLQRRFVCFTADERDEVLESLAAEGLLELDARRVRAVPLAGFIGSLSSRACLGEPELRCPALLEEWKSAKAPQTVGRG
ncbi:MAG: hypothetical protein WCK77_25330 [Verrucomicrobiota bacterium]